MKYSHIASCHAGSEIGGAVDLEAMPLYVRAGAMLPFGPVKQYTGEHADAPLSISVYPGADGVVSALRR
ncbi:MAG: hypothetical protein WBE09_16205 [Candidatus Acidiferrales bacterium]